MSTTSVRQYNFVDDRNGGVPITASRVDGELDNVITKLNQKVIVSGSAPSSPIEGQVWYDSTNDFLKVYRNSEWVILGVVHSSSTVMSNPQVGDIWIDTSGSENVINVRNKANDGWIVLSQSTDQFIPAGAMMPYAGTSAPSGWLLCDGSAVSRTTYATLFALVSTTYGVGDGSTTFNLPDLRGRTFIGLDNLGGTPKNIVTDANADSLGGEVGTETHTLSESEMPAHTHTIATQTTTNGGGAGDIYHSASATTGNKSTGSTGGGGAHNNIQPSHAAGVIIKT